MKQWFFLIPKILGGHIMILLVGLLIIVLLKDYLLDDLTNNPIANELILELIDAICKTIMFFLATFAPVSFAPTLIYPEDKRAAIVATAGIVILYITVKILLSIGIISFPAIEPEPDGFIPDFIMTGITWISFIGGLILGNYSVYKETR